MITVKVRGIDELKKFLAELPYGTKREAIEAVTQYHVGNEQHGSKHLVHYRYVSRKQAYGQTFQSEKQRRWFFAALRSGELHIPYKRTGATQAGWQYRLTNQGYNATIYNATKGARYAQGDDTQSRHEALVGHRKVSDVISTNIVGAMRAAYQAVQRWIKA